MTLAQSGLSVGLMQPPDIQAGFRDGFAERVEGWRSGAGYELPCAIKVGSGTR